MVGTYILCGNKINKFQSSRIYHTYLVVVVVEVGNSEVELLPSIPLCTSAFWVPSAAESISYTAGDKALDQQV